jgi:hypothetical protein
MPTRVDHLFDNLAIAAGAKVPQDVLPAAELQEIRHAISSLARQTEYTEVDAKRAHDDMTRLSSALGEAKKKTPYMALPARAHPPERGMMEAMQGAVEDARWFFYYIANRREQPTFGWQLFMEIDRLLQTANVAMDGKLNRFVPSGGEAGIRDFVPASKSKDWTEQHDRKLAMQATAMAEQTRTYLASHEPSPTARVILESFLLSLDEAAALGTPARAIDSK